MKALNDILKGRTLRRILLPASPHDECQLLRAVVRYLVQGRTLFVINYIVHDLVRWVLGERRLSCQYFPENDGVGVNVGFLSIGLVLKYLWCHPVEGASHPGHDLGLRTDIPR